MSLRNMPKHRRRSGDYTIVAFRTGRVLRCPNLSMRAS